MADYDWRIERAMSIVAGSNDPRKRGAAAQKLLGSRVTSANVVGRIPELQLGFSNGLWLVTAALSRGQPSWAVLFSHPKLGALEVKNGRLHHDKRGLLNRDQA